MGFYVFGGISSGWLPRNGISGSKHVSASDVFLSVAKFPSRGAGPIWTLAIHIRERFPSASPAERVGVLFNFCQSVR